MDVEVIPGRELEEKHCRVWERIRAERPALGSPYLSAEFTRAVARVRDDVWVGVLGQGGEIGGFFPHQRAPRGVGLPVAFGVNDFHGPVISPGLPWTVRGLLEGCGLDRWRFNHLRLDVAPLDADSAAATPDKLGRSPYLDLRRGFDAYLEDRRRAGSRVGKKIAAQSRRLERDLGPLRFVDAESDPRLLDLLLEWKDRHLAARGESHRLARPWVRALLERLHGVDTPTLSGVLSSLRAGEHLLALHLGLRARAPGQGSWHYWIPAYDPLFARYSPGLVLLLSIIRHAAEMGLERVDLGRGVGDYKERLMNACDHLAEGVWRAEPDPRPPDGVV